MSQSYSIKPRLSIKFEISLYMCKISLSTYSIEITKSTRYFFYFAALNCLFSVMSFEVSS